MNDTVKTTRFSLLERKTLLLSFFLPFFIAGGLYHCVYVGDASIRSQGIEQKYPKMLIEKAVELEESHRWTDPQAWMTHLLIFGVPSGVLFVGLSCALSTVSRRNILGNCG
jgi:hypothetical protein